MKDAYKLLFLAVSYILAIGSIAISFIIWK